MTDLQLALIVLGVLIIAAVVAFNWWQERSFRQESASRFTEPEHDVLMNDFRVAADEAPEEPPIRRRAAREEFASSDEEALLSEELMEFSQAQPEVTPVGEMAAAAGRAEAVEAQHAGMSYEQELLAEDRQEPYIHVADAFVESPAPEPVFRMLDEEDTQLQEPQLEEPVTEAETPALVKPLPQAMEQDAGLPADINQQIDLAAVLFLPHPVTGSVLREHFLAFREIDKPVYAFGLDADRHWRLLTREQELVQFSRCACSLQLADRSGPISRPMLIRFQNAVEDIGRKLGAQVEWQDKADPAEYAQELDQFCMEVDKLVSLHIVQGSNGPFTGTKFRGLAEASGLVLAANGAFQYLDEHGQVLFSLVNQDNNPFNPDMLRSVVLKGVVFQLDIPHVKSCAEVFNQMVLAARQMATSLNANLVDDNYRLLTDAQIEKIRQQLKMIHAQMVARGIVPGSACALRLFS